MHPYPRKMATPLKSGTLASEKLNRSGSPDLCLSEPENQSPTSVLSTLGSDAFGTVDSTKPSEQSSPVSSAVAENSGDLVLSEPFDLVVEESRSSPARAYATSNPANQACVVRTSLLSCLLWFDMYDFSLWFVTPETRVVSGRQWFCERRLGWGIIHTVSEVVW